MAYPIIHYDLSDLKKSKKVKILRELFGYKDSSHKGKYKYSRKGILKDIKHLKIFESTITVKNSKDERTITNILKENSAPYKVYKINLSSSDWR